MVEAGLDKMSPPYLSYIDVSDKNISEALDRFDGLVPCKRVLDSEGVRLGAVLLFRF